MYTDYEGMEYDVTVGYEIEKDAMIPSDMTEKVIPAGKYAKFVLHGDVVKTVQQAWTDIWKMNLERTFVCDFEEYQEGKDMETVEKMQKINPLYLLLNIFGPFVVMVLAVVLGVMLPEQVGLILSILGFGLAVAW